MDPTTTAIVVALVIIMTAVTWFELRYLRRTSKARRAGATKRTADLPDEAHNAMVTTRAIVSSMDRTGVRGEDVGRLMDEAELAFTRRNYRVALDLTSQVRDRLMTLKKAQAGKGDLAKLETAVPSSEEEPTVKERLQKEYPPNMLQAKFTISLAESSVASGRAAGRDVASAEGLLSDARSRYEAQDYAGALTAGRLADKSARGEQVEARPIPPPATPPSVPPPSPAAPAPGPRAVPPGSACPTCGAATKEGDAFCRKCGTRVVLMACPTCGAALQADDLFCRKCGTRLAR